MTGAGSGARRSEVTRRPRVRFLNAATVESGWSWVGGARLPAWAGGLLWSLTEIIRWERLAPFANATPVHRAEAEVFVTSRVCAVARRVAGRCRASSGAWSWSG